MRPSARNAFEADFGADPIAPMTGSQFFANFVNKSQAVWESAAFELAKIGSFVKWPMVSVPLVSKDGKQTGSIKVMSDYFAIGTLEDFLYLPLAPIVAQRIADLGSLSLPTTKLVRDTWRAAALQIEPFPMRPTWESQKMNPDQRMITLAGFNDHNTRVQASLNAAARHPEQLISGTKKDVVISNKIRQDSPKQRGSVAIYGWFDKSGALIGKAGAPIQGLNPSDHVNSYADYSHGIRFVEPIVTLDDGRRVPLTDPSIAGLVSDEGAITTARYSTGTNPSPPVTEPPGGIINTGFVTPVLGAVASLPDAPAEVGGNMGLVVLGGVAILAVTGLTLSVVSPWKKA